MIQNGAACLLRSHILLMSLSYIVLKRYADISGAAVLMAASLPLWVTASLLVRFESRGPVIFTHERVGLSGKSFNIYKFRSMRVGSEDLEASLNDEELEQYYREFRLDNDPRVTRTGRFMRKRYIDELPQLLNVLMGKMSLVGPRPVTLEELDYYTDSEKKELLAEKPGLTGYWQVFGKGNATYQNGKRQQMELYYARNASLRLDLIILIKTPAVVLRGSV